MVPFVQFGSRTVHRVLTGEAQVVLAVSPSDAGLDERVAA